MAEDNPPDGFVELPMRDGYGTAFGPVWLNMPARKLGFRVSERHLNVAGTCHGGALATFADLQVAALRDEPRVKSGHLPTIMITVDYLSPALLGAWVEAQVSLAKATRTLIFTNALLVADGTPVARSAGIYKNPRPEPVGD